MMILKIVIILLIVSVIAIVMNGIEDNHKSVQRCAIPFKESMDLLNVPVVTFVSNGVKLHLLLDTGSDYSYIDETVIPSLNLISMDDGSINIKTGSGSFKSGGKATIEIAYKDHVFEESFVVASLKESLDATFGPFNIQVHGILGSAFFAKYKYEINFEDLIAYAR